MTMQQMIRRTLPIKALLLITVLAGLGGFLTLISFGQYERAWQIYLVNFLFWSAVAQGGLLFSMIMHVTQAKWSRPLENLSEAFVAFFPISFILFLGLYLGREHIFPWIGEDLHGKEVWLNIPFLFTRDTIGLLILYGLGGFYVHYALKLKVRTDTGKGVLRAILNRTLSLGAADPEKCKARMTTSAILYMMAYACVLSLISFDLVMSLEPHWISTLFGGYFFIKALYVGLGALIIVAAVVCLSFGDDSMIGPAQFHDIGKLFFAFCVVWAYFLYVQVMVIWYGNIPEETHYLINRFKYTGWKIVLITAFTVSFIIPFFTLLNQKVKTKPVLMLILCTLALSGIWLENLLAVGPPLHFDTASLGLRLFDILMSLGFLGLMASAVTGLLKIFPELFLKSEAKVN